MAYNDDPNSLDDEEEVNSKKKKAPVEEDDSVDSSDTVEDSSDNDNEDENDDTTDETSKDDSEDNQDDESDEDDEDNEEDSIPEDIERNWKVLLDIANKEDEGIRMRKVRQWRMLELLWQGFTNLYWDDGAQDWRTPTYDDVEENEDLPRAVNIYRPHGLSVIAAISNITPGTVFYPDDADNPDDIETANGYKNLNDVLNRHCRGKLIFIKANTILFNCGVVYGYNYYLQDEKYGVIRDYQITLIEQDETTYHCPQCGYEMDEDETECPGCGYKGKPNSKVSKQIIPQLTGQQDIPKGREKVELFSPLFVKTSIFARQPEDHGYLRLEFEQADSMLKNIFPDFRDKIKGSTNDQNYDRWARLDAQYYGDLPRNVATVTCLWLRPWFSEHIKDDDERKAFQERYPTGGYAIFIDKQLVEENEEPMDDHWTISKDPTSTYMLPEPIGAPLATIQDIRNDLLDIEVQTAEYGVPETFVNPRTLDFNKYGKERTKVGMITAAIPEPGKRLEDSFYTGKFAQLAPEVRQVKQDIDQDAQFAIGDFPSVYGGTMIGGSKTAHEYEQSRGTALQRLSLNYFTASEFWCELFGKATTEAARMIKMFGDEKHVVKDGSQFRNIWIRRSSLSGTIGHVEPEYTDQLPFSLTQQRQVIMDMMKLNSPMINAILADPRNSDLMKRIIGIPNMYIPGEMDRNVQLEEFYKLIVEKPLNATTPSVDINPDTDDDVVHMDVIKYVINSPIGRYIQETNPNGYENVVLHYKRHEQNQVMKTIRPAGNSAPLQPPPTNQPPTLGAPNGQ